MSKRDYYDVLGVGKTASAEEIRRAHRKLVRQYHPDMNRNNPAATEKFKEVQEAYDILSDPAKRKSYDEVGHVPSGGVAGEEPFAGFRPGSGAGGRSRTWRPSPNVTVEDFDLGSGGGLGADIFEQLFGGRGRRRQRQTETEAEVSGDVEHSVSLSFEDAARGTTVPLQINRGGQVETIELKVPAGVKDGSRIRVRGKGNQTAGNHWGDLYITTRVRDHAWFRRDGLDILLEVPISVYEAMLGTKVDVPTLEGRVTVTVPPGTNSGAKLRIRGRGIQRGDESGDEFVVVKIVTPKDLDAQGRELAEKLAAKHPINPRGAVGW